MTLGTYRSWNWLRLVATRAFMSAGLACLLLLVPAATRADSTQTYNVTGTLADGDTVNGTITIDFTTGVVTTGPGGYHRGRNNLHLPGRWRLHDRRLIHWNRSSRTLRQLHGQSRARLERPNRLTSSLLHLDQRGLFLLHGLRRHHHQELLFDCNADGSSNARAAGSAASDCGFGSLGSFRRPSPEVDGERVARTI